MSEELAADVLHPNEDIPEEVTYYQLHVFDIKLILLDD